MKFQIYTYMFRPINLLDFDGAVNINPQDSFARKQEILEEVLEDEQIKFRDEDKEYGHKHLISKDNITILRIQNHKQKNLEASDFKKYKADDYPSAMVIVDNRKDVQRIAISCEAFGKNELCEILQFTFRERLKYHRLSVDIRVEYKKDEFWAFCSKFKSFGGIEYVIFSFPYPNLPRITDKADEYFTKIAKETNSEPVLKLQGQGNEGVIIDEDNEWMKDAVEVCARSGAKLEVKPKNGSLRLIGSESALVEEMGTIDEDKLQDVDLFDENTEFAKVTTFLNDIKLARD